MSDITVNVTSAGAANVSVSNGSTVNATVGNGGSVNVAVGTVSPGNATVVAGTLTINSTTTLAPGASAYAKNVGTAYAASLDIGIPSGNASTVQVGSTTTLDSGNASVTGSTNGSTLTLAFAIPRGAAGANGTNGTNGTNGVTPTFSASASTLSAGSSATVTTTTTNNGANVALAFGIPQGAAGSGGGSNLTLSDATPSALGTAAAGSSTSASRSDHTHALPSLSTLGAAASNHAHNYVTSLNNLTGGLTLAAGSNVTITSANSTLTIAASGSGIGADDAIDGGTYIGEIVYPNTITITQQPSNQTASAGAATFSITASVTAGTLAYQWQRSDDTGTSWSNVTGATSASLAISGLSAANDQGDQYRVLVSAAGAQSVTSSPATLTVPGTAWVQRGSVQSATDSKVALSANGLLACVSNSSSAKVLAWSGTDWAQRGQSLYGTADNSSSNANITAMSFSRDGSTVALVNKVGQYGVPAIRVYDWNGSTWLLRSDVTMPSNWQGGASISLNQNGTLLAYGLFDGGSTTPGEVRAYQWTNSAWSQRGSTLTVDSVYQGASSAPSSSVRFGFSVALSGSGSKLFVAHHYAYGANTGESHIFTWSGTSWTPPASYGGYFTVGASIAAAISDDGQVTATAWGNGFAYASNASSIGSSQSLASSIALNGTGSVFAFGSPGDDAAGSDAGIVQVFSVSGSSRTQRGSSISGTQANSRVGFGVAIDATGDLLAVSSATGTTFYNWA